MSLLLCGIAGIHIHDRRICPRTSYVGGVNFLHRVLEDLSAVESLPDATGMQGALIHCAMAWTVLGDGEKKGV